MEHFFVDLRAASLCQQEDVAFVDRRAMADRATTSPHGRSALVNTRSKISSSARLSSLTSVHAVYGQPS